MTGILAITGGTGFVGRQLVEQALQDGWQLRLLTRKPLRRRPGVTWIHGALEDHASLALLCQGADAVIHVAGLVNALDRAGFAAGNIAGTQAIVDAARAAGVPRFVHVSSLAAREPALSDYGWSKREGEPIVAASGLAWSIVRPPAVYGPGDREMLQLFRLAAKGRLPMPPRGRMSVIHADDLARLLIALATPDAPSGIIYEPDDGQPDGWDHADFGRALGTALGRPVKVTRIPKALIWSMAATDTARAKLTGKPAKLSFDRARYFCHPDWTVAAAARPPAALWTPQIATPDGLRMTVAAYREKGWLR